MKKILSIILALTLMMGLIPTAFASDTASEATSVTYKFYAAANGGHSDVTINDEIEDRDGAKNYTAYPVAASGSDRAWAYLGTTLYGSASKSGFINNSTYVSTSRANQNEWIAFKIKVPKTATYALSGQAYQYRYGSKNMQIYIAPMTADLAVLLAPDNKSTYGSVEKNGDGNTDDMWYRTGQKLFNDDAFRILDEHKIGEVSLFIKSGGTNEKTIQPIDTTGIEDIYLAEGEYVLLLNNGSEETGALTVSEITLTEQVTEDTWGSTEPEETTLDTAVFTATTNIPDVAEVTVDDKVGNLQISSGEAGRTVSVSAPDMTEQGYTFIGWQRGVAKASGETYAEADGTSKLIDLKQNDAINVYTNTFLTAVYEKTEPEVSDDPVIKFWNQDKSYLGKIAKNDISTLPEMTLIGHSFLGWYTAPEDKLTDVNAITADTNVVAQYNAKSALDSSDENDIITVNGVARTEKNYGEEVICPADGNVTHWLRDGKIVSYGAPYTHYIWDATEITSSTEEITPKPLVVLENTTIDGAYMIEYDGAEKDIVEVGILFGTAGSTPIVGSAFDKYVSQRNGNHGQLAAKPIDESYTVARGYMVYIDNGKTYVIYSE